MCIEAVMKATIPVVQMICSVNFCVYICYFLLVRYYCRVLHPSLSCFVLYINFLFTLSSDSEKNG